MQNIFHEGELAVQQRAGESQMGALNGRIISTEIPPVAQRFISKQSMALVSSQSPEGQLWVSLLTGNPGFVEATDSGHVTISRQLLLSSLDDILFRNLTEQPQLGILFIDLTSRRRFRVNGQAQLSDQALHLTVVQAFGNCPKYIQKRRIAYRATPKQAARTSAGQELKPAHLELIRQADTFYVGSSDLQGHLDASHRGGKAGFVEVLPDGQLKIPDYPGNSMFNTLGNFESNPAAAMLFVDYAQNSSLQLSGKATLQFEARAEADLVKTGGTGRFWSFEVEQWIETQNQHQLHAELIEYSPFNP